MLDLFKKIIGSATPEDSSPDYPDIQLATAAILLEMGAIDGEFSAVESGQVVASLKQTFDLADDEIEGLIAAAEQERRESIDLWRFTNAVNRNYSEAEKVKVIEAVWKVVYADGRLDGYEDYLVHQLARLLRLRHDQLIAAKLRVKEQLGL